MKFAKFRETILTKFQVTKYHFAGDSKNKSSKGQQLRSLFPAPPWFLQKRFWIRMIAELIIFSDVLYIVDDIYWRLSSRKYKYRFIPMLSDGRPENLALWNMFVYITLTVEEGEGGATKGQRKKNSSGCGKIIYLYYCLIYPHAWCRKHAK